MTIMMTMMKMLLLLSFLLFVSMYSIMLQSRIKLEL